MHPLDNPVHSALAARQAHFAEVNGPARRFLPEISMLSGLASETREAYDALAALVAEGQSVGLVVDAPPAPVPGFRVEHDAALLQMVFAPTRADAPRHAFTALGAADSPDMVALADVTKPGPFGPRTHELGGYIGIREGGRLVAMAGYRMQMPGFTEISAICTHPDHAGQGYARSLTNALLARILAAGDVPFLHVRESNARASDLYERMGFRTRRRGRFVVLKKG